MTIRKKTDAAHIIINPSRGSSLCCLHCGTEYKIAYPAPVDIMSAIGKAFDKLHRRCKATETGPRCPFCLESGHTIETCPRAKAGTIDDWLAGPDTGISSCAIVGAITGRGYMPSFQPYPPADPSDFGRCYRLLKRFPELRPKLPIVAEKHAPWHPFIREWDRLTRLYEEESPGGRCPKLFAVMTALGHEVRAMGAPAP